MTSSNQTPFPQVAGDLSRTLEAALPKLRALSATRAAEPLAPGKWSSQQVIGHLVDSAANNHQRFVRAMQAPALIFPEYLQDEWVGSQRYEARAWEDVVLLWHAYNRHLAHVIEHIPEQMRDVPITIGEHDPVTLGFLAHDYVVHMRHHLKQIGVIE
jgi:hypothetical protein